MFTTESVIAHERPGQSLVLILQMVKPTLTEKSGFAVQVIAAVHLTPPVITISHPMTLKGPKTGMVTQESNRGA